LVGTAPNSVNATRSAIEQACADRSTTTLSWTTLPPHNAPKPAQDIDALICWMDESAPLQPGRKYAV
jgi:hypothetical protein